MVYAYQERSLTAPPFNATNAKGSDTSLADVVTRQSVPDAEKVTTLGIASMTMSKHVLDVYITI